MDQVRQVALTPLNLLAAISDDVAADSRPRSSAPGAERNQEKFREESWPGKLTVGELILLIVVIAIGLRVLPRPLDLLVATSFPAIYFPARIDPRLALPIARIVFVGIMLLAILPNWLTEEPSDLALGKITALALTPLFARIATWRSRSGTWDFLDPLVIATAPVAFASLFAVATRLFEIGILSW